MTDKKVVLTGDTPTGKLHIGHYVGTLENRVKLQDEYETFIILADLHALSTLSQDPKKIKEYTREVLLDNLAVGLDPEKVTFFAESLVPELYELAAFLSMYVSHNRALRNPTVKDEIKMKGLGDTFSLGFVNYPIYQAADILCVKANLVPVGVDQVAHLEQARELARDINKLCGKDIFPVPEAKVGRVGKLVGTDGNPKMGKSLNNTIFLSEEDEGIEKKIMNMYTDPNRIHATDPGNVEGNPMFIYLDIFSKENDKHKIEEFKNKYKEGKVGDVEIKEYLSNVMKDFIRPMRERRKKYENEPKELDKIIKDGSRKVRKIVSKTLKDVKKGLNFIS
ncbi:MAG: tryptophan--tRNA ligase [Patescibacteria group bacterium]